MRANFTRLIFIVLAVSSVFCADNEAENRDEKLISTFQIVRFPNDVCVGTSSRNGTCYTSAECSDKGGTSAGSCADGFGVCCTFVISKCGQSSSENNTYWTQPTTVSAGTCDLTICPMSTDICSIRLDFTTFVITGPSSRTSISTYRRFGQPVGSVTSEVYGSTYAGQCLQDSFTTQSASPSSAVPITCGTNTGQHAYVEADPDRCNRLIFNFADGKTTSILQTNARGIITLATRTWDIRAQQIECTSLTLPPPGCTQYFYSSPTAAKYYIQSSNYVTAGTSWHLANQHDRYCIRRERGKCIGCFAAPADTSLQLSGSYAVGKHYTTPGGCCGYSSLVGGIFGANAAVTHFQHTGYYIAGENAFSSGYDCVIIPGAFGPANAGGIEGTVDTTQTASDITQTLKGSPNTNNWPQHWPPQICGNEGGIGIGEADLEEAAINAATAIADVDTWTAVGIGTTINVSVCTRNSPFVLEFMSDDLDGQGGESGNTEWQSATHNRGFNLVVQQIDCA